MGFKSGKKFIRKARLRGARRLRRRRYAYPSIKQEPKWFDSSLTGTAIPFPFANAAGLEMDPTFPAALQCLNCPAVGDTQNNRDGRKIVVTSLEIKGFVLVPVNKNVPAGGLPLPITVWVALVIDTQTNQLQLNSEDVYTYINVVAQTDACQP